MSNPITQQPQGPDESSEPAAAPIAAPTAPAETYTKPRRPFSKIGIELDQDDLAQKGVQKMILAEVERLEGQVGELREYERRFHEVDKKCAIHEAKRHKHVMLEILYTVAIAGGFTLTGWLFQAGTTFSEGQKAAMGSIAGALVVVAVLAKWTGEHHED